MYLGRSWTRPLYKELSHLSRYCCGFYCTEHCIWDHNHRYRYHLHATLDSPVYSLVVCVWNLPVAIEQCSVDIEGNEADGRGREGSCHHDRVREPRARPRVGLTRLRRCVCPGFSAGPPGPRYAVRCQTRRHRRGGGLYLSGCGKCPILGVVLHYIVVDESPERFRELVI